jgi:hypothetical protein
MTWNVAPAAFTSRAIRARSLTPHDLQGALVEFRLERSSATIFAFCLVTGRACDTPEAARRMSKGVLLALALALCACWGTAFAAAAISGIGDVEVRTVRVVPSSDSGPGLAAGSVAYVIATVALTNGSAHDIVPAIDRFFLTAPRNVRYQGADSGSSALVGVSNPHTMLKHGDTRDYTVGFRTTEPVVAGTISYEP